MTEKSQVRIRVTPEFDADVLIVGAGPAGAAAACHLARQGYQVIAIDKQRFPRDKVCGDFVGPVALMELKNLGITSWRDYKNSNRVDRASLYLDGEPLINEMIPLVPGLPSYGRVIPRTQLDHWIVLAAQKAGAKVLQNCRLVSFDNRHDGVSVVVENEGSESHFLVKALIGADGSRSKVGQQIRGFIASNEDRIVAVRAYFEAVSGPQDQAELYFNADSFPGYYWLFPTGQGQANVGVGMLLETLPKTDAGLRQLLLNLIDKDPALRSRLKSAKMVGKITGWPLNTYNPKVPLSANRVLLTGDSAGLINPLNGEGIQYALLSGRWAAQTLGNALVKGQLDEISLSQFDRRVQQELRYDMALATLIVQMIRNRIFNPVWLRALQVIAKRARVDPDYATVAGGVLAGLVPASHVLGRKMIVGTLQQAIMSVALPVVFNAITKPRKSFHAGIDNSRVGLDIAWSSLRHLPMSIGWGFGVANGATELAGQVLADVLKDRDRLKNQAVNLKDLSQSYTE